MDQHNSLSHFRKSIVAMWEWKCIVAMINNLLYIFMMSEFKFLNDQNKTNESNFPLHNFINFEEPEKSQKMRERNIIKW